ncbi:putative ribonuclease P/MRP protein subunit POP5 [Choanephora cucurbitarum]|uniref:Ribonuclease P/MRP protein subunit POP5 n=1 Tax=Choanephora cucurbitarum TaxID=101091 RepID=A0A1C7NA05_9FUNG|nr:putative ribonuclease P/MRP protein subunit POP5 [Choanephora cucurbitarum]
MVRFKNRWVLFQIIEDPILEQGKVVFPKTQFSVNDTIITKAIFQAIETNYGHFGKGQGNVTVKWYNPMTRVGILRIPRDYTDMYLSTMFFMKQIGNMACSFSILRVSGTIIFIQQAAIEWDRQFYLKEQAEAEKKGEHYNATEKIMNSKEIISALS